jgi:hypothetical protein
VACPRDLLECQSFLENNGRRRRPWDLRTFRVARASCLVLLPNYFYGSRTAKFATGKYTDATGKVTVRLLLRGGLCPAAIYTNRTPGRLRLIISNMKRNSSTRSAFINPRTLIGFVLLLMGALLALFALDSQKFALLPAPKGGGAGVPLSRIPGEPLPATSQDQTPANYTGPHKNVRPVEAVRTRPLRELPKIPPALAVRREVREPARPKPPTDKPTGGFMQTLLGPAVSAPTPTGLSFDGVGVGLAGFVPSSNPPDSNGRVGAKQYVQWNNTSFAVFNKTTGARLFRAGCWQYAFSIARRRLCNSQRR